MRLKVEAIIEIQEKDVSFSKKNKAMKDLHEKANNFESAMAMKIKENESWWRILKGWTPSWTN